VLARGSLLEWCRALGLGPARVPHTAFADFRDVAAWARELPREVAS